MSCKGWVDLIPPKSIVPKIRSKFVDLVVVIFFYFCIPYAIGEDTKRGPYVAGRYFLQRVFVLMMW